MQPARSSPPLPANPIVVRASDVAMCVTALERCTVHSSHREGLVIDAATGAPVEPLVQQNITPFHSSAAPPITVTQYASRLATYSGYGIEGVLFALILIARYVRVEGTRALSLLTVHRLMLASLTVVMKANCDFFYKNIYLAQAGGIPVKELNRLEQSLLQQLHFSVMVTRREVEDVLRLIPRALARNDDDHLLDVLATVGAAVRPIGQSDELAAPDAAYT